MYVLNRLKETLKKDKRLTSEDGDLLKSKIIELSLKLDKELLRLLLNEVDLKKLFFEETEGFLVFNYNKFIKFIDNKEFLPDSFTTFKNKIGLAVEDRYLAENKEVVLCWPYKDCILEGGMEKEDEKRDEVFYNEILAPDQIDRLTEPKVLTSFGRIDITGEHKVTELKATENFILKGNNLLALCSLEKKFLGTIKLIYIDPPYGRDADVFYNDSFRQSTWLTFMKNRLEVAKKLLSKDGAIFVQISDVNEARLRILMDEVFGKENFVNKITVRTKAPSGFQTVNLGVFEVAEYILIFAKNKREWKYNPQFVSSNYDRNYKSIVMDRSKPIGKWEIQDFFSFVAKRLGFVDSRQAIAKLGKHSFFDNVSELALKNADRVFRLETIGNDAGREIVKARDDSKRSPNKVFSVKRDEHYDVFIVNGGEMAFYSKKIRKIDGKLGPTTQLSNIWTDISWEGIANEGGVRLKRGKKPEKLLRRIIDMGSQKGDIVLDFFAGSGTTCAVAQKMGRRFIGIEQLNYEENDSVCRLKNVIKGDKTGISKIVNWQGGGDFVYCELMEWNDKYMTAIAGANSSEELLRIWNLMTKKAFLSYKVKVNDFEKNVKEFEDLSLENQRKFLFECLDKNHLYVNLSEIDDKDYGVPDEDKRLNRAFYGGGL